MENMDFLPPTLFSREIYTPYWLWKNETKADSKTGKEIEKIERKHKEQGALEKCCFSPTSEEKRIR